MSVLMRLHAQLDGQTKSPVTRTTVRKDVMQPNKYCTGPLEMVGPPVLRVSCTLPEYKKKSYVFCAVVLIANTEQQCQRYKAN
jgi:hypothetical protein